MPSWPPGTRIRSHSSGPPPSNPFRENLTVAARLWRSFSPAVRNPNPENGRQNLLSYFEDTTLASFTLAAAAFGQMRDNQDKEMTCDKSGSRDQASYCEIR